MLFDIIRILKNDGIIYGGSAGTIIFGKSIDTCQIMNEKIERNTKELNFLHDISLLCHFNKKNQKENHEYLKQFSKNNKVIFLLEEDVLVITNNNIKIIGNRKYTYYQNEEVVIHTSFNLKKDLNNEG